MMNSYHALRLIFGGFCAFVVGGMLFWLAPDGYRWRGLAAFPLGIFFIWLGIRSLKTDE